MHGRKCSARNKSIFPTGRNFVKAFSVGGIFPSKGKEDLVPRRHSECGSVGGKCSREALDVNSDYRILLSQVFQCLCLYLLFFTCHRKD